MKSITLIALFQIGLLTAPDPAQMEHVPDLGYKPVAHSLVLPEGAEMGAPSSVATNSKGHLIVFTRGARPILEFDADGRFVRGFGEGLFARAHGLKLDRDDNIWTTDVTTHTVIKMSPTGEVLLTLGVKGQAGDWNEAAGTRLLNEPNDVAIGPTGDIFVVQGHGRGDPRVLKFDRTGKFVKTWGGKGTAPGQFDTAHAIVIDAKGLLHVADRQNRRVQIFDNDGTFVEERKYPGYPCGLFIGADQQLYMVSGFSGQIIKLDAKGKAVAATGQPGKLLGEFGEAHYMAMTRNGDIYVADTVNRVLHKFVKK